MNSVTPRTYPFLDTVEDREALIKSIATVRRSVLSISDRVPEAQWYEPRYHGWSLAALLAHLHTMDNLCMLLIQFGMLGIHPPLPPWLLHRFNDTTANIYRQRIVTTTRAQIMRKEPRIADFIRHTPIERFSRPVFDPALNQYLTVEQSLCEYYVYHWQEHLQTLEKAEGLYYEPPAAGVV